VAKPLGGDLERAEGEPRKGVAAVETTDAVVGKHAAPQRVVTVEHQHLGRHLRAGDDRLGDRVADDPGEPVGVRLAIHDPVTPVEAGERAMGVLQRRQSQALDASRARSLERLVEHLVDVVLQRDQLGERAGVGVVEPEADRHRCVGDDHRRGT
jgi:hypothetical protein